MISTLFSPISCVSDGRLREDDQILAVNGNLLDSEVTQEQAVKILQEASSVVTLTVARGPVAEDKPPQMSHTVSLCRNLSGLAEQFSVRLFKSLYSS